MSQSVEQAELTALNNELANLVESDKSPNAYPVYYGEQYDKNLTVKESAAAIRSQLRKMAKAKHSPLSGAKVSVRYRSFSGGSAIDVKLSVPYPVMVEDEQAEMVARSEGARFPWLTEQARAAKLAAMEVHEAYNFDGSQTQVDYFHVKYYGSVDIEGE